ncbi:MAG: hypothetical protein VKJ04_08130 [Vampirovibrionales bacterium]|nr:hypothetical protein [Vampirovibrionales bacterium]
MRRHLLSIRPLYIVCLGILGLSLLGLPATVMAQASDDTGYSTSWPDDIDYAPSDQMPGYLKDSDNPIIQRYKRLEQAEREKEAERREKFQPVGAQGVVPQIKSRRTRKTGIWPFRKEKPVPLTEEEVTKVGPRQTAIAKEPLLALPISLSLNNQRLPSGFYLVRQDETGADTRHWYFIKENRVLLECSASRSSTPTENVDSPLEPSNPALASTLSPVMEVEVAPVNANRQQTAVLILQENGQRFVSEPFTVLENGLPRIRREYDPQ